MRVFLRNSKTRLYYASNNQWAPEPEQALDLGNIEHASKLACEGGFMEAEVILAYDNPICQLSLPVRPEWREGWAEGVAA